MFGDSLIPLFILVFLILSCVIYLWIQKREALEVPKRGEYSIPTKREGFQTTSSGSGSGSGSLPQASYGSNSGSGSLPQASYGSNSGYYPGGTPYGFKEKTPYDSYYDVYERNEQIAKANIVSKLKTIEPVVQSTISYGQGLGGFDTNNPVIPWDADNSSLQPSDVVWGVVSVQASRSIFLKTWLRNIMAKADSMPLCGEDSANFCYKSPVLKVQVHDPAAAIALKIGEDFIQSGGQQIQTKLLGRLDVVAMEGGKATGVMAQNFSERLARNKAILTNFFDGPAKRAIGRVQTTSKQIGGHLVSFGNSMVSLLNKVKGNRSVQIKAQMAAVRSAMQTQQIALQAVATAATVSSLGATAATGGAATPLAIAAAAFQTFITWFFGVFGMIMMSVEAVLQPIVDALLTPGGVCPEGSKQFSKLIDPAGMAILTGFIPLTSLLQMLDPYICWCQNGQVKLMTPPRTPPFMSNTASSLSQHSDWIAGAGNSSVVPVATNLVYQYDPLPAGYKWLSDPTCDLANSPNANSIIAHASSVTNALTSRQNPSFGSQPTNYLAVETCATGTVPSEDGFNCIQAKYNTTVKAPILSACPEGSFDDGYNCWNGSAVPQGCSGGTATIIDNNIWSDTTGYLSVTITPLICNGVTQPQGSSSLITKWYNERISCPKLDSTEYDTDVATGLCYAKCQAGYSRENASCVSPTATYTRNYMHAKISGYYDSQPYNAEKLLSISDVKIPYCNYSSPVMLTKMAKFYRKKSLQNPQLNSDGTVTTQAIIAFKGVIASSELSCDVACVINFMTYDPVTGEHYSATSNGSFEYKDDPDPLWQKCNLCFRRFYFIRGDTDPQGQFTVTGCTWQPYTAPDAMTHSGDESATFVTSLGPNGGTFEQTDKSASIVNVQNLINQMSSDNFWEQQAIGQLGIAINVVGGKVGGALGKQGSKLGTSLLFRNAEFAGDMIGGLAAGVAAEFAQEAATKASRSSLVQATIINSAIPVLTCKPTNPTNCSVVVNNNWWTVNLGTIYELAIGYVPTFEFCDSVIVSMDYCTNKYVVRDMVNKYHNENQQRHIKSITAIEPRGDTGCYYKFTEVLYDSQTNMEGTALDDKEIILNNVIGDDATCTFSPTLFVSDINDPRFPVRSYKDPSVDKLPNPKIQYPTRNTVFRSDVFARFVRVRPPLGSGSSGSSSSSSSSSSSGSSNSTSTSGSGSNSVSDGYLNLTQISVFDISGMNVSVNEPTYATSVFSGAADAASVVNGTNDTSMLLADVWQQATTNSSTEYWEVDLGKNVNISEVVYFGGFIKAGRSKGVRIEFLYSNSATEIPIFTYTLQTDEDVQYIPLYSSSYTIPSHPVAGPIRIPMPIRKGVILGAKEGCTNKCEDKATMDALMYQYNTSTPSAQIVKILRGITGDERTCEYEAEVMVEDTPAKLGDGGSILAAKGKTTVVKQILSMNIQPDVTEVPGAIKARYIRVIPSFTPATVLEFSTIIVWDTIRDANGVKKIGRAVSQGESVSYYNAFYELEGMTPNPLLNLLGYNGKNPPDITNLNELASSYPVTNPQTNISTGAIFQARSNDPETFFQIDLTSNYEIFRIDFIGRADSTNLGAKGVQIQLFASQPGDESNCCSGKYPPVRTYTLQGLGQSTIANNSLAETIIVAPPPQCKLNISSTNILAKPVFLQDNAILSTTVDTSGGVFSYSGIVNTLQATWDAILPMKSTDMVSPIQSNLQQSNVIVRQILDTVSASKTIKGTQKKCSDTDVLSAMMTAYNIQRGPKDTDDFGVVKHTMNRILKSAQSTDTTCDVLYEDIEEVYDDYIVDITDKTNIIKSINAVRFTMNAVGQNAVPDQKNIIDISANALGLVSNSGVISPPFTGPTYAVNCRDINVLKSIKASLTGKVSSNTLYKIQSNYTAVRGSFQSTPLSCEYMMSREDIFINKKDSSSYSTSDLVTYVKAVFNLGLDGKTTTLGQVTEYYPKDVTISQDYTTVYMNGATVTLPSIYDYDNAEVPSSRVNTTVLPIP